MRGPLSRRNHYILQNEFPGNAERWTVWTVGAEQNREFITNPNRHISPSPTPIPVPVRTVKIPRGQRARATRRRNLRDDIANAAVPLTTRAKTYARGRYQLRPRLA